MGPGKCNQSSIPNAKLDFSGEASLKAKLGIRPFDPIRQDAVSKQLQIPYRMRGSFLYFPGKIHFSASHCTKRNTIPLRSQGAYFRKRDSRGCGRLEERRRASDLRTLFPQPMVPEGRAHAHPASGLGLSRSMQLPRLAAGRACYRRKMS